MPVRPNVRSQIPVVVLLVPDRIDVLAAVWSCVYVCVALEDVFMKVTADAHSAE